MSPEAEASSWAQCTFLGYPLYAGAVLGIRAPKDRGAAGPGLETSV